jgi:hypothetical protein
MSDYKRQQECPPLPKNPAAQPHEPGNGDKCEAIPPTTPPTLYPPDPCTPDPDCKCPKPPSTKPTCIDNLISKYTADIAAADGVKAFKTDLDTVLANARNAEGVYTRDKYIDLAKRWVSNDDKIADLIRKLVCSVPCWKCVIECYVCPLLNDMHIAEQWLCRDTAIPSGVQNLYDLQHWYTRDVAAKDRRLQRIKAVLAVWKDPGTAIDTMLNANANLIASVSNLLGTDPGKAVYDVFLKLVPQHLAIAPPSGSKWTTMIGKEYTEFCGCDTGKPDDCCGPNVGVLSFRQRSIGPQPYLIDPSDFFKMICCLVEKRYAPAKEAWTKATAEAAAVDARIASYVAVIGQFAGGLSGWDKTVRPTIPSEIDCCDYDPGAGDSTPSQSSM